MNIDAVGKFYLGAGGIGDFLLTLATFYDTEKFFPSAPNIIFLANEPSSINELVKHFNFDKKLVLKNDWKLLNEFYHHKNCIGTGILPKNLDYSNWYRANPFVDYGVKEFPKFVERFKPKRYFTNQIFVQRVGSSVDGDGKRRIIDRSDQYLQERYEDYSFVFLENLEDQSYENIFSLIRGSEKVIGVDSFVKTFSAMCGIETIVYDNIYTPQYLSNFKDKRDYGHYIFLDHWSKITLIPQM